MLEPKTDEERKALRLWQALEPAALAFANEAGMADMLAILAEARAIVREEQAVEATVVAMDVREFELEQVRAEIYLRSEVLRAFPDELFGITDEVTKQLERFLWLLGRERSIMGTDWQAKSEPEGGDRG